MPSASCLLSVVFSFGKVTQGIFSELHGTKTQGHISPSRTRSPKGRWRRATRSPHHLAARVPPARRHRVWGHRPLPRLPFRLFKPLWRKTLSTQSEIHKKFYRRCRHQPYIGRVLELFPAPCRRGDHHQRALHHHSCLRSDAWVVHPWAMGP